MRGKYPAVMDKIAQTGDLTADDEKTLSAAIEDFKKTGTFCQEPEVRNQASEKFK